jgi:hypothetical protein
MKNILSVIVFIFLFSVNKAQTIVGSWAGELSIPTGKIKIVFNVSKNETGYTTTMDSPDQNAKGIPTTSTSFENDIFKVEITAAKVEYNGTLKNENTIEGTFKQSVFKMPLTLTKLTVEDIKNYRPQTPQKPYSYYTEDVTFENKKAKISLAGTFTAPSKEGKFPVVVLVSGSGPQNRDEELFEHKPFLVIADYLAKNGIATLRYDDRGIGASNGDFGNATTADFADDAEAAIEYLKSRKEIDVKKMGIAGHSEGGIIAPMIAARNKGIAFVIMLAGSGIDGGDILLIQKKKLEEVEHLSNSFIELGQKVNAGAFKLVKTINNEKILTDSLNKYFTRAIEANENLKPKTQSDESYVKTMVGSINTKWMKYFIKYNPYKKEIP